jgi:hypothetical protein
MSIFLAVALLLLCGPSLSASAQPPPLWVPAVPPDQEPPPAGEPVFRAPATDPFAQGLAHFRQRRFAAAAAHFERARKAQGSDDELRLLLGICYYRLGEPGRARPLLEAAGRSGDPEVRASARLFLGMIYDQQGATDRARAELLSATEAQGLVRSARGLVERLAPRRLYGSLLVSPEYDGNVPLTRRADWEPEPAASSDGDVLFAGSLTARPFRHLGLTFGDTLSYRQQFRLRDFSLLHNSAFLGYAYLGDRHRVRVNGSFNLALLGGALLYLQGGGAVNYRARLWSQIGLTAAYAGAYRAYPHPDFTPYTGHTHTGQADLNWGLQPEPVTAALGYQVQREELAPEEPVSDFRAWAHGPYLRLRARPHRRLELLVIGTALFRQFDHMPSDGSGLRRDFNLAADVSLSADLTRWLETFVGATIFFNQSNRADFSYIKPGAYAGLSASFSVL